MDDELHHSLGALYIAVDTTVANYIERQVRALAARLAAAEAVVEAARNVWFTQHIGLGGVLRAYHTDISVLVAMLREMQ